MNIRSILVPSLLLVVSVGNPLCAADPPPELARWLGPQRWDKDTDGPIVSLGKPEEFDDMHIFAPAVARERERFLLWYPGSRGSRTSRVFRLGLATGPDGKRFEKDSHNPVLAFADGEHSVLTPGLLRAGDGNALREDGKLRMWFASADLRKGGLHTLHESRSADGIAWDPPSAPLAENVYCPTVLEREGGQGYQMWFADVSKRPWVIRYAESADGVKWQIDPRPAIEISQEWEAEIVVYPCVLKIDGVYLMWYGSYYSAVRRQTTAIGFAVSTDGRHWHKHPQNPVITPDEKRPWESNYVGSGCVMRLADGSFRYWYASRKAPPFENLYFAINTARWTGLPATGNAQPSSAILPLPPKKGDRGRLLAAAPQPGQARSLVVQEVVDDDEAVVRAHYQPNATEERAHESTFVDLWVHGITTGNMKPGEKVELSGEFLVTGNKVIDTTCGGRSLPALEATGK